ncbi:MFS transporter [Sulfobacillus harzensis]|uniref:MFS transporter n=1 Tax=Sulfobacillus harzensis TaxID=2729629 RepID=A0A7Y0L0T9_9FIRM|nr:MFS transporter [Sulfobacillus harzensis]NMP20887.1 MFS transporter [Sulfobacillus harzensis]
MESRRWQAILILLVLALTYGLIFMERTAPGLVTPELMRQFHLTPGILSLMTIGQYLVYAVLQIPVALGARRFRAEHLLVVGTVFDGMGTVMFGLSHSFSMVVVSRVLVGLGDALIWLNIVAVLARWFSFGIFGRVLGITGMSGNVGALVATIPLAVWVEASGWRAPFAVMGWTLIALAAASFVIFWRLRPMHPEVRVPQERAPWDQVFRQRRELWAVALGHFGLMGPFLGFVSLYAVPYLRTNYGLNEVAASTFLAFGLAGALLGGPPAGMLADKWGVRRPYAAVTVLNALVWVVLAVFRLPLSLMAVLFILLGAANGAAVLTFATVRERFPNPAQGLASGIANTAGFLGAVLVPAGMGLALSLHASPRVELMVAVPFALSASLVGVLLKTKPQKSATF